MKNKIFLLLAIFLILSFEVVAQQCVQCEGGSATGTNASIIGTNNIASGNSSFAGGKDSEAIAKQSFAFGDKAQAKSLYSIALGKEVTVWGGSSLAIGKNLLTSTTSAMVIGAGFDDNTYRLKNEIPYSLMIGFNSSKPTFFVSESSGSTSTGKIGIGNVTDPQAKLHILGDSYSGNPTEASLYIQSAGNYYSTLWLGDKNHSIYTKPGADFKFKTSTNNHFVFENGNVEIGTTSSPEAKLQIADGDIFIEDIDRGIIMKSPDGNCWRGTVNNQGQMQFTQVDCDNLALSSPGNENEPNWHIRIYPNPTGNQVTVEIAPEYAGVLLSIKSSSGNELETAQLRDVRTIIDLSRYPAGLYFFNITQNARLIEVKKIVKK